MQGSHDEQGPHIAGSSSDLARLVEDSLNEIYVFGHDDLRFVLVNRRARENLGYSMAELRQLTPVSIKPSFSEAQFRHLLAPLQDGSQDKLVFETEHRRKDGSLYPAEVHLQPGEFGGRPVFSAIILDISARRQADEARRKMEQQILETQKLESLGVLAGGIAHDFNNILTSVMGYADLARLSAPAGSDIQRYLDQMLKGATRGAELIRQMLAYSGKGRFIVGKVHLPELISEISGLLQVSISKNCSLRLFVDDDIPPVSADATQLRQVILNLIVNASEAIGEREGLITVRVGSVRADRDFLAAAYLEPDLPEQRYVTLEVSDSGIGMSPETMQRIFEPFFTTKFTGRGLGLSAIMGIVRGHKGALRVYSEPGKGSTFKILLPALLHEDAAHDSPPAEVSGAPGGGCVLVVDDEQQVRELATELLHKLGYRVVCAIDGMDGLAKFRSLHQELDLVLLDLTMPRMDGTRLFTEMRRINASVPTILSSGYNEQATVNQFAGKGLAGFLPKPYTLDHLAREVAKVLG